jgi:hypothetical protein
MNSLEDGIVELFKTKYIQVGKQVQHAVLY